MRRVHVLGGAGLAAAAAALSLGVDLGRTIEPPAPRDRGNTRLIRRCYFEEANALPPEPPRPLTKRQRRRLRGKGKR